MKSLIIDTDSSHANGMRTRFINRYNAWTVHIAMIGAGVPSGNIVTYQTTFNDCVDYAIANGYNLITRNYDDGFSNRVKYKEALDAGIICVTSDGSNDHVELAGNLRLTASPIFIGGGVSNNEKSYSNSLEGFDASTTDETAESWSTASVAARLAKGIDDFPTDNVWDLRQRLRQSTSQYDNGWVLDGGYGKFEELQSGELDLGQPLNIISTKAVNNQSVAFTWQNFEQTKWVATRIVKSSTNETVYEGTGTSTTWYSDIEGNETFKFYSVDAQGNLSADESYTQIAVTGLEVYVLEQPSNIQSSISEDTITISWDAVLNADAYTVGRRKATEDAWTALDNVTEPTFTDTVDSPNTPYVYRIKAISV